jgi:hypothetical protein
MQLKWTGTEMTMTVDVQKEFQRMFFINHFESCSLHGILYMEYPLCMSVEDDSPVSDI